MREHWTDRLSEYLDGELAEPEAGRLEAHLEACDTCENALREIQAVVDAARLLPAEPPGTDLWPAISERLAPRAVHDAPGFAGDLGEARRGRHRRITLTIPQLAAAAIAVVLFSASGVWLALSGTPISPGSVGQPSPAASVAASTTFASTWESAIANLEAEFAERRASLDAETILVVERNLAIIDQAIEEARDALEGDPSSAFLNGYVAEAMRRKVDLLRQATRIQRADT